MQNCPEETPGAFAWLFCFRKERWIMYDVLVIGGGVSKAGQVLIDGILPYFHKYVFHAASGARFTLASLGNDAGAYGAFKLALDAFHA